MKQTKIALLLISAVFTNTAAGIVIRHDVPDEKYSATVGDFPPLATLYSIGAHGTLIDPQWVVTAGHAIFCMEPGDKIKVGNQWAEIEQRYSHVDYELDEENDIALLKLKQPVQAIKPAKLYRKNDEETQNIWFIGGGGTGNGNVGQTMSYEENEGKLRKAQNTIYGTSEREIFFSFDEGENAMPLEGVSGNADSGGPAYKRINDDYYLYGISSRNDSMFKDVGEYGVKEVYTRVSYHANWIDKIMQSDKDFITKNTTQKRFAQDNVKDRLAKVCEMVGYK
jgi:secreted trypsin-like serine protease